jgi:hypothetical protein
MATLRRARNGLLALAGLVSVGAVAVFGLPGALIELGLLLLGLIFFGYAAFRNHGGRLRAVVLVFVIAIVLITGTVKMIWLLNNLPSQNENVYGLPYLFIGAICPVTVVITTFFVRNSRVPLANKAVRVASVGLLVGFVPWLILMLSGIAD